MSQRHAVDSPPAAGRPELTLPTPRVHSRYGRFSHHRFRLAVAALLALGVCSLAVAVGLSAAGRTSPGLGDWSAWSPIDRGLAGAQEIADYVAPYYRATPSQQLAVVTAVNLANANSPVQVVVPGSGSSGNSLVPLPASSTIVYNLCGLGSRNCSVGAGSPSAARLLLLRREALELALYTFKYLSGFSTVVAILPPGHQVQGCVGICPKPPTPTQKTTQVNLAVAFDQAELQPLLDRPLRYTLPEEFPPAVSKMAHAPEAEEVSIITAQGLFQEHTEQAQDGSSVILLDPTAPQ
jgi:hypothetical protein